MFQISVNCPKCLNKLQDWDPSLEWIKCNTCLSIYFSQKGVFHIYPDAKQYQHVEIIDKKSSFARIYEESTNLSILKIIVPELFNKQISSGNNIKIFLDAGCGYGDLAIAASEYFDEVIAVDADDMELEYLANRVKKNDIRNIHVFKSSLGSLPFAAEQFSGIGCIQVLEHVNDPKLVIGNLHSVLLPGGLLYLSTPNKYSVKREAHTKLWGIGYLPIKIALIYARIFKKYDEYKSISLVSTYKLRSLLFPFFGNKISFIRSGIHNSLLGKFAKWAWEKPFIKHLANCFVADIEVIAYK